MGGMQRKAIKGTSLFNTAQHSSPHSLVALTHWITAVAPAWASACATASPLAPCAVAAASRPGER